MNQVPEIGSLSEEMNNNHHRHPDKELVPVEEKQMKEEESQQQQQQQQQQQVITPTKEEHDDDVAKNDEDPMTQQETSNIDPKQEEEQQQQQRETSPTSNDNDNRGEGTNDEMMVDPSRYREITLPHELEDIIAMNPVLQDIRVAGAHAKREDVYPTDNTAEYVYRYLQHFPAGAYALPQSFRKVIKGLHAGHWLSKKIDEIKNRRWRSTTTTTATAATTTTTITTTGSLPDPPPLPPAQVSSPYGKLSAEEATALRRCNPAFWELYIQHKPPDEVLKKRQAQYDKKKAHNARKSITSSSSPSAFTAAAVQLDPSSTITMQTMDTNGDDTIVTANDDGTDTKRTETIYHEVVDPKELEMIVQRNPVLRDIRLHGAAAKREDVYPADSTAEYVYTFLEHFPPNSFALPQTFRKVIKGLHAGHWLSKKIEEIKNRRWRTYHQSSDGTGGGVVDRETSFGKLSMEEAQKLQRCNMAFWQTYIQRKPSEDIIRKRQDQYEKKTAHNKSNRTTVSSINSVQSHVPAAAGAVHGSGNFSDEDHKMGTLTTGEGSTFNSINNKADIIHHATTAITSDITAGAEGDNQSTAVDASTTVATTTIKYTEIVDPTAITRLETIVQNNPVLLKIREYGPTAKREDVFPTNRYELCVRYSQLVFK